MGIVKQPDANTVELAGTIRQRMAELQEAFPTGLQYHIAADTSVYIEENIRDLQWTIAAATSLVILVVLAFLRSGRGTFVVAMAIPTSLLIGLAVINLLGLPLQDRPSFFVGLLPHLQELRARTGRPHWIVVDEAHHLLPASWDPATLTLSQELHSMAFITVHPDQLAPAVLSAIDTLLTVSLPGL
jgi:hypothetical protein